MSPYELSSCCFCYVFSCTLFHLVPAVVFTLESSEVSAIFAFTTKTTQPCPQVFSVNGASTCSGLHFWHHFLIKHKILPNLVISNWLWWIVCVWSFGHSKLLLSSYSKLLFKITFCLFTPSYQWQWMFYLHFFKTHFCCCSCAKIRCSIWVCRETPSGICWEVQATFSTNTHGKRCHFWWTSIECCCRQIKVSEAL